MQEPSLRQHRPISSTINRARTKLRNIGNKVSSTFRKPQDYSVQIIPSPFIDRPDQGLFSTLPPKPVHLSRDPSMGSDNDNIMDGAAEREVRRSMKPTSSPVSAIFIHAGAGYHSTTNEHIHLGACSEAARLAMRVLRAGGSAVDAVEAAIKVLEDKEITNAGYGSNLSIDGVVECDATVVDHLGRSGACGATAQVKNPINLARLILDLSTKPLSLRRVPPNLLVGQGATDFAWEHGIPIVPHDMIVSKNARDRFLRWREDLRRAEGRMTPAASSASGSQAGEEDHLDLEYEERVRKQQRRDHTQALLNSTWNEGQPDSPGPTTPAQEILGSVMPPARHSPSPSSSVTKSHVRDNSTSRALSLSPISSPSKRPRYNVPSHSHTPSHSILNRRTGLPSFNSTPNVMLTAADGPGPGPCQSRVSDSDGADSPLHAPNFSHVLDVQRLNQELEESTSTIPSLKEQDEDMITDTVGAIAIDMYGQIAAGSSSGGIGMKHRGRVGPAALVGIGSAVMPADENDPDGVTVAAVTSGTGEHMATTMASQKCAERLYHSTRRAKGGQDIEVTEEEALHSFIQADFMGHPGVKDSISAGAIGVMAVKKSHHGYFLYFAHNTDSFALASMHSNEKEPKCVMSRIGEQGSTVQGGRKIRID